MQRVALREVAHLGTARGLLARKPAWGGLRNGPRQGRYFWHEACFSVSRRVILTAWRVVRRGANRVMERLRQGGGSGEGPLGGGSDWEIRCQLTRPPELTADIAARRWRELNLLLHSLVLLHGEGGRN